MHPQTASPSSGGIQSTASCQDLCYRLAGKWARTATTVDKLQFGNVVTIFLFNMSPDGAFLIRCENEINLCVSLRGQSPNLWEDMFTNGAFVLLCFFSWAIRSMSL